LKPLNFPQIKKNSSEKKEIQFISVLIFLKKISDIKTLEKPDISFPP
jgi:hypothetical protein